MKTLCMMLHLALASELLADEPFVFGALGDSISTGFNAEAPMANWQLNWATGRSRYRVKSHLDRLRQSLNQEIRYHNFALAGSHAADVLKQVEHLIPQKPDYVTFMIGGNDVCAWPSSFEKELQQFKIDVGKVVSALVRNDDRVKIQMVAVPGLAKLFSFIKDLECRHKAYFMCDSAYDPDTLEAKVLAANIVLTQVADQWKNNVRLASDGLNAFRPEHVSALDCFHPSVEGQAYIAEMAWVKGWYTLR